MRTPALLLLALIAFSAVSAAAANPLRQFDVTVTGNCTGKPIVVAVTDTFNNQPMRALVSFKVNERGVWREVYFNWTGDANGSLAYTLSKEGEYMVSVTRPGYIPFEKPLSVRYCPQCRSDDDCALTQFCTWGSCENVTGVCGYAHNHRWVAFQCCSDDACAGDEDCIDHLCLRLTGSCGRALNHTWYQYDCCTDADCGAGKGCSDHACVVVKECESDVNCPLEKRCLENRCIALVGECGYASNHRWVSYECCMDASCASGYCRDDHTCSPSPRPGTTVPPVGGGGNLCGGAAALILGAFLLAAIRR